LPGGAPAGFGAVPSAPPGAGLATGFGAAGLGVLVLATVVNASQARVSALTCMPYAIPPCRALVQLKNLSPVLGLKLAQLPQMLPAIYHSFPRLEAIVIRYGFFVHTNEKFQAPNPKPQIPNPKLQKPITKN
jgi:hypothetical protein